MKEKIEHVKFIISRYDTYIESTQTKSNLYLALNTAIIAGIITLVSTTKPEQFTLLNLIVLGLVSMLAVLSITLTLIAINPYLKSASKKSDSIIFFNEVSSYDFEMYAKKVDDISDKKLLKDLNCQAFSLATALKGKYQKLYYAGRILIFEFALLFIYVILLITKTI